MRRGPQKPIVEVLSRNRKKLLISKARHNLNLLRFPRWGPEKLTQLRRSIRTQNKTISEIELTALMNRIRSVSDYGGKGLSKEKVAVLKAFLKKEGVDVTELYGIYTSLVVKNALESKNMPQVVATSRAEETQTLNKLREFLRAWNKAKKKGLI